VLVVQTIRHFDNFWTYQLYAFIIREFGWRIVGNSDYVAAKIMVTIFLRHYDFYFSLVS